MSALRSRCADETIWVHQLLTNIGCYSHLGKECRLCHYLYEIFWCRFSSDRWIVLCGVSIRFRNGSGKLPLRCHFPSVTGDDFRRQSFLPGHQVSFWLHRSAGGVRERGRMLSVSIAQRMVLGIQTTFF